MRIISGILPQKTLIAAAAGFFISMPIHRSFEPCGLLVWHSKSSYLLRLNWQFYFVVSLLQCLLANSFFVANLDFKAMIQVASTSETSGADVGTLDLTSDAAIG